MPKGLRPEEFGKKSVLRNSRIAGLLHRADYIEKMGTGIRKMQRLMSEARLPPLEFQFTSFFTVTFRKPVSKQEKKLCEGFGVKFGEIFGLRGDRLVRIVDMLEMLNQGQKLVAIQIAGKFEITTRAVAKDIKFLRDRGIIKFMGAPKTGRYMLTERGVKLISDLNISGPRK